MKTAILLVFLFKEISLQTEVSSPHYFRIQGGSPGRHDKRKDKEGGGRIFLCLIVDDISFMLHFPGVST